MSSPATGRPLLLRVAPPVVGRRLLGTGGARYLIERNIRVYRNGWAVLVSGVFEPVFYLLSVGVGVAQLVGDVELPGGQLV
ncbi:MAG: ABC transporter permease, partial [Actinomycetes bacterium]